MFNWANKITFFRIACVPIVVILLYFPNRISCLAAMSIFILAALSDMLDGFIARKYNLVTNMGKFLDPLADKLLVMAALIMLSYQHWLEAWISILIVEREIMVTGLRSLAMDKGIVIAADKYGKLKTIIQILALCPLILHYPWFGFNPIYLGKILIYIALFLTLFSGVNYVYKFYKSVLK
ncbi:CDP-diacylglycerol--glycerol-3-phosphate 3-phosphatidyltransferase [Desulfonauticus submarinus]|uniref:CDP-diacylglycerol--glycerol-3-phosphate 3-phosphatidyltransferase n=1 Tax=Desulfonauticus submarinus TaxID=206665 RepID=A0A1H0BSQ1_9BACT|nr:CDP-diacylglycerol--glycerol-3-phosphate 3-phosphatidyltransferase [Desulfonauticus submarinus]SDN48620.1 CDP-diacylglycerol--glycerol-3-phosphate 3-phosphatidyltransferase [Desulfonauticus submarinus]